ARVRAQMLLDLVGEDLQAAAVDHRADASVDPHEPVVVDPREVAGAQPTVGREPVAEVAGRRRLRPHLQLVVAHAHLDARVRPPHRAELRRAGMRTAPGRYRPTATATPARGWASGRGARSHHRLAARATSR